MIEVLQFIFSSFWIWLGTAILIAILFEPIRIILNKKDKE
jgi:hypothetical protein